jgi:energy-coupling factor transport system permease protein
MSGSGLFIYRRLPSPLHAARAGAGACWVLALTAAAVLLFNPLALLSLLVALLVAAACAGVGRELSRALRTVAFVALPIVLVNVLVSRQGLTVFARLGDLGPFGQGDLTVEALAYGADIALKVSVVILLATLGSLAVDPDELLRSFRRLSFRSALTVSLALRMIPLLAADARRLGEAQRTRPHSSAHGARARIALLAAIVASSLDRAMDVAATLEVRGFASGRRAGRRGRPLSRHDLAFVSSAVAVLALALAGRLSGALSFDAYPLLTMDAGTSAILFCVALVAAALLPFAYRRGVER